MSYSLRAAGARVEWKLFEGCYNGFDLVQPEAEVSREANSFMRDQLAFAVDNYFAPQPARR